MNGIVIINKPQDWTSFDVVAKIRGIVRRATGEKNIKVGHGGTLDPLATGVLPVFIGRQYTKLVSRTESADKEYIAEMKLGITTDTQDITGNVISETRDIAVTESAFLKVLPRFTGEIAQLPPMYSAIKIGGRKLYEIARRGSTVEREARNITVYGAELLERNGDTYKVKFVVSKGTYIRTLCNDIGDKLGCGAVMTSLVRTRVGKWKIEDAVSVEDFERRVNDNTITECIIEDLEQYA